MERYAILIPADSKPAKLIPCDGDTLPLKALQGYVGGYIETVPTVLHASWTREQEPADRVLLIVNEEGLLQGLPYNSDATCLTPYHSQLVGDAVLMIARGEELMGFTEEAAWNILTEWTTP